MELNLETRKRIYQEVLDFLESGDVERNNITRDEGLCNILPQFWKPTKSEYNWEFEDDNGNLFKHLKTPDYFPEFAKYFPFPH
jgi:hypothetical protein